MAARQPGCCSNILVGKFAFLLLIVTPVSISGELTTLRSPNSTRELVCAYMRCVRVVVCRCRCWCVGAGMRSPITATH